MRPGQSALGNNISSCLKKKCPCAVRQCCRLGVRTATIFKRLIIYYFPSIVLAGLFICFTFGSMIIADERERSWKTVAGRHRLTGAASKVKQLCRKSRNSYQVLIARALNIEFSQFALTETMTRTKLSVIDIKTIISEHGQGSGLLWSHVLDLRLQ